jgi:hypothetical protein
MPQKIDLLAVKGWRDYYWLIFRKAFSRGWSIFSALTLVAAFAAWAIGRQYPEWEKALTDLSWQIPASVAFLAIALRWIVAPYEIHTDTVKQANKTIVDLGDSLVEEKKRSRSNQAVTDDLEAKREQTVSHEWNSYSESMRAALRFIAVQPAAEMLIKNHVESKQLPWDQATGNRLLDVLATRDWVSGKFSVMPEYERIVRKLLSKS